jgi:hypothetical protein
VAQALALRDAPPALITRRAAALRGRARARARRPVGYGVGFSCRPSSVIAGPSRCPGSSGASCRRSRWLTTRGVWADARRARTPAGRLQVGAAGPLLNLPLAVWMLVTDTPTLAFVLAFPVILTSSMWIGPGASTVQDLVLPRMRGSVSAAYLLVVTFIGLALGPYTVGRLSVAFGDLRSALLCALTAGKWRPPPPRRRIATAAHDEATGCLRSAGSVALGPGARCPGFPRAHDAGLPDSASGAGQQSMGPVPAARAASRRDREAAHLRARGSASRPARPISSGAKPTRRAAIHPHAGAGGRVASGAPR